MPTANPNQPFTHRTLARLRRLTAALALSLALILVSFTFLTSLPAQAALPLAQGGCPAGGIAYVNRAATSGSNTGADWPNALLRLQDALALKAGCPTLTQIWVAQGVYTPTTSTNQNASFVLTNTLEVYGGFTGTETLLSQRNVTIYLTILSGDLLGNDGPNFANNAENSYHVVVGSRTNSSAVLDGFTIRAGNSNNNFLCPMGNTACGGGMFNNAGSPTLRNLTFIDNSSKYHGGGMYNTSGSNPSLTNVTFSSNSASFAGGGIHNSGSSPSLTNVIFHNNSAGNDGGGMSNWDNSNPNLTNVTFNGNSSTAGGGMDNLNNSNSSLINVILSGNRAGFAGGGIYNFSSSPSLTNVTFSGNSATNDGGGMYNSGNSNPRLINVTFSGNNASGNGGGMFNTSNSNPRLDNSLLWGNSAITSPQIANFSSTPVISYSLIQGSNGSGGSWDTTLGTDGGHNLDADPLFVAPIDPSSAPTTTGNYRLQVGSPAIDAGNNSLNLTPTDLDGQPRIQSDTVDLGAYESAFSSQEIAVLGNGQVISDGDASPNPADHTQFGSLSLGGAITRTFTISNSGDANLLLTGSPVVSISGPAAADFSLVAPPTTPVLSHTIATFQVRFASVVAGTRVATITIANNDSDENPYDFAIQGTGPNQPPVAEAGSDQNVTAGNLVTLDGSASTDPDNHLPLTFGWTQTGGPVVTLSSTSAISPTLTAPGTTGVLTFSLIVTDSFGLADPTSDEVVVTVGTVKLYLPVILKNVAAGP